MKEPRTIEGQWHIFGDDQPAPYGTLCIAPEAGLTLETKMPRVEGKTDPQTFFRDGFTCSQTIHGTDGRGQPVTLLACMVAQSSTTGGLETYTIRPLVAIAGGHFKNWSEVTTQTVCATFSLLDAWLCRSTIRTIPGSERPTFTQGPIPDIEIPLPDARQIVITCGYTQQHGIGALHLTQEHVAHFNFPHPEPLSKIRGQSIHVFRQLLTLLTGSKTFIDRIRFPAHGLPECELLSSNSGAGSAQRDISHGRVLVHYKDIAADFPGVVARWFRYYDQMEPVVNLYHTACWNTDVPITTKFLLLAQALEAYHSRSPTYTSAIQAKPEFRQRLAALLKGVPEKSERAWLREKLQHANQKTLAQRLNELIAAHQKETALFLHDPEQFAATVRHARNYFTHFNADSRLRAKIPEATGLSKLALQMRALLEICFVRDLELPEVAVQQVIRRVRNVEFVSLEPETTSP